MEIKKIVSVSLLSFFLISGLGAMIPQLLKQNSIQSFSFQKEDFQRAFWSGQYASAAAMLETNTGKESYLESELLSFMAVETYLALEETKKAEQILQETLAKFPNSSHLAELLPISSENQ